MTNLWLLLAFGTFESALTNLVRGSGLRAIVLILTGKIKTLVNIYTDNDRDNERQLREYVATTIGGLPYDVATALLAHNPDNLNDFERADFIAAAEKFGEYTKKITDGNF